MEITASKGYITVLHELVLKSCVSRCLVMDVSAVIFCTLPAFRRHVTILLAQ
jgi:hypothetical protein